MSYSTNPIFVKTAIATWILAGGGVGLVSDGT